SVAPSRSAVRARSVACPGRSVKSTWCGPSTSRSVASYFGQRRRVWPPAEFGLTTMTGTPAGAEAAVGCMQRELYSIRAPPTRALSPLPSFARGARGVPREAGLQQPVIGVEVLVGDAQLDQPVARDPHEAHVLLAEAERDLHAIARLRLDRGP